MKYKRGRTPSHWLVEDIYLRDTWGRSSPVSRRRRLDLRSFFVLAMVVFGIVDLVIAYILISNLLSPTRPAQTTTAVRAEPTRLPTVFARRATAVAVVPKPTHTPTNPPLPPTETPLPLPPPPATGVPTLRPTQPPPPAPPTAVSPTQIALASPLTSGKILAPARTMAVNMPPTLNLDALAVAIPAEPADCTPASLMPDVIAVSVKLCPGQVYRPFLLRGQSIGVFGDKSARIQSNGHGFAIIAEGAGLLIQNVMIRATTDGGDAGVILCLYPDCQGRPGGVAYGGGVLVRAPQTTIMDSDISGGVAGVAAEHVTGLKLINNHLDNSSGWGSYNFAVDDSYFVGNSYNYDNRSCTSPDGVFLPTGCESAGWLCVACQKNIVARNTCTNSGDCYYINGEGNLQSNNNRFHQNECRASPHNCFEVTFSLGNEFVENIAQGDPDTGTACKYPFWVGGSQVFFARNKWSCTISPDTALRHASDSTNVPTSIQNIP